MREWWEAMEGLQKVFAWFALPSTLFLILQIIMSLIGLFDDSDTDVEGGADAELDTDADIDMDVDTDVDTDVDMDADTDFDAGDAAEAMAGLRFFTIRGIIAFLAIFGWTGIVMLGNGASNIIAIIIALVSGFAAMFIIAYLFYIISKLQSSGNINLKNAIGHTGEVYLTIPADNKGFGKVNIIIQERLSEVKAFTEDKEDIPTGSKIKVVGVVGGIKLKVTKI
jgi:membrane protein implicated in regulation of membrane protease activity